MFKMLILRIQTLKNKIMKNTKNTISRDYIINHILDNYGELRHDPKKLVNAVRLTAKKFNLNRVNLFHYIIERRNTITGATSYGFDTAYGREIRKTFEFYYYN